MLTGRAQHDTFLVLSLAFVGSLLVCYLHRGRIARNPQPLAATHVEAVNYQHVFELVQFFGEMDTFEEFERAPFALALGPNGRNFLRYV